MKNAGIVALCLCACALIATAQTNVGGYKDISVNDPTVKKAFALASSAIKNQSDIGIASIKLDNAAVKIVAGKEYMLVATATDDAGKDTQWQAIVNQDLKGKLTMGDLTPMVVMTPPLSGGYTPVSDLNDAGVQEAFNVAKADLIDTEFGGNKDTQVTLVSAQSQVVAGTNYLLTMEAQIPGGNSMWEAVVFEPLPSAGGSPEVTSLKKLSSKPSGVAPGDSSGPMVGSAGAAGPVAAPTTTSSASVASVGIAAMAAVALAMF